MTLEQLSQEIVKTDFRIENGKRINEEKEELLSQKSQLEEVLNKALSYRNLYDLGMKLISDCQARYKNERKQALEEDVENVLELAFPDEHFKVNFHYGTRGKDEICTLRIGRPTSDGVKWGSPQCRSGDFNKQLMSYSIVATVLQMLGSETLLADEPFSNGDPVTLAELQPFFEMLQASGLQLGIIEHQESVYTGLTRREIILEKDRSAGNVHVVSNSCVEGSEGFNNERKNGASIHTNSIPVDEGGNTPDGELSNNEWAGSGANREHGRDDSSGFRAIRDKAKREGIFSTDGEIYLNT